MSVTTDSEATDLCERARSLDETDTRYFWLKLLGIVSLSAALRLVFFQGMLGGDDLIYFMRASEIAHNIWNSSDYIGASQVWDEYPDRWGRRSVRTKSVFGCAHSSDMLAWRDYCCRCHHEIGLGSANCTLRRFSAVLGSVADQQCHQHSCGSNSRPSPSRPRLRSSGSQSVTIIPGFIFVRASPQVMRYWVKEASVLFLFSFGLYIAVVRRWSWRWLYSGLGALIAFAANCMLMWIVTGHPFHGLAVMHSTVETQWTVAGRADSPFYYVKYLLFDIRHTWLLGIWRLSVSYTCSFAAKQ